MLSTNHGKEWCSGCSAEDLNKYRNFKVLEVSSEYACDDDGRDVESRKVFARVLGVRDGTARKATEDEQTAVAMNLYFYFCNVYEEAEKAGHWKTWDEESAFPHEEYAFESHTTRDVDGVFDGFDVNVWATDYLLNGLEGTKAVEVTSGPIQKKTMMWDGPHCGIGLENSINKGVDDHLDAQGAMTGAMSVAARKKKVTNILNDVNNFLKRKGWFWGVERHLFVDPGPKKEQKKMRKYCGKKVGVDWCILMLKPLGMMQGGESV